MFSSIRAPNRVYTSVEANGPIKRINIYRIRARRECISRFTEGYVRLIPCMHYYFVTDVRLPLIPYVKKQSNYIFHPYSSPTCVPLRFFAALDTEPPFFHNIVTAFRGTASTLLPVLFFSSLRSSFFLCSFPFHSPSFSIRRVSRPPPAAHHVLQYRRAASGVTPVIRDGPDEAFIILSEGSLSIRQHTVIIQSNG